MTAKSPFVPLEGGCRCGGVRFRIERAPIITHCCHCRLCQQVSGAAFRINTMIEAAHLTLLTGSPRPYQGKDSHKVMQCPDCALALWSHHTMLGGSIAFVGIGMLDEGERLAPEVHYFTRSKHPWITLPADVTAFDQLGDPGKAGARARIEAALAAGGPAGELGAWTAEPARS